MLTNNNFLFHHAHTPGDLTLNSNVTCDLLSIGHPCIFITQDDVTLDCNGYSIIGPGTDTIEAFTTGILVFSNNVIIKNCNVEHFFIGIDLPFDEGEGSGTVESTTVSNNDIGIAADFGGSLTLKNVLAENNQLGLDLGFFQKVVIDNAYFCNNSSKDISTSAGDETCPEVEATGQIFASTFGSDCSIEDVINESLEENEFDPIVSCTDLVAQQSLLSDM